VLTRNQPLCDVWRATIALFHVPKQNSAAAGTVLLLLTISETLHETCTESVAAS
jgi:hypothetical protein